MKEAQAKVRRCAEALERKGLRVRGRVVFGSRVALVIKLAIAEATDLVVLSSHRVNLARPGEGWGTISYQVGILAPCPVLLVK